MNWGVVLTPATIMTGAGALLAIGVGVGDAWFGHAFGGTVDLALVTAGLGALLGHAPILAVATMTA